jgi:hypothetical protein
MKPLLILSILFFTSCGHNSSQQASDVLLHDTPISLTSLNSKPKEFECGTSELLKTQLIESGLTNPDNFREVNFITTKQKFFSLLSMAKRDSLIVTSFDSKRLRDFYIPTAKDSIWLTLPFIEVCQIKKGQGDSLPINISYSIDTDKRFTVHLTTDSTITNRLTKIIKDNRLGSIKVQN